MYKAIDIVEICCADDCVKYKGDKNHDYCYTPFLTVEFDGKRFNPYITEYGCIHCLQKPHVIFFDNEKERDDFNHDHNFKYVVMHNKIRFDYGYFEKYWENNDKK